MNKLTGITNRSGGFSLLEVMVAMAIIAIALTAVFRMQSQTTMLINGSQFYTVASLLAQKKMAEIHSGLAGEAPAGSGEFGEPYSGYSWSYAIAAIESETLGKAAEDLKRVDVTISLVADGSSYSLRQYIFGPHLSK